MKINKILKKSVAYCIAFLFLYSIFFAPSIGRTGEMPSFLDIGIHIGSMKIEDPEKLKGLGMREAKLGDVISVNYPQEGTCRITNTRTGESIIIHLVPPHR